MPGDSSPERRSGSRTAFAVVMLATASAACAYFAQEPGKPPPTAPLVADSPVIDLGLLDQHTTARADFTVRNRGSGAARILRIDTDCSRCTRAAVSANQVAQGKTVRVSCEWDTLDRRGETGSDLYLIYAVGESRAIETLKLRLTAVVRPDLLIEPRELRFGGESPLQQVVTCTQRPDRDVTVRAAYCTHHAFAATLTHDANQLLVTVAFDPAKWAPDIPSAALVLETSDARERLVRVPLFVTFGQNSAEKSVASTP